MGQGTFFLGLGTEKAGTTWLYNYLCSHPKVQPGYLKGMYVLSVPEYGSMLRAMMHIPWRKFSGRNWIKEQMLRVWFRADWNRYFNHFEERLSGDTLVTGELDTTNMLVDSATLKRVKSEFAARAIRVVPIFLMRDPVDRLYSAVRFYDLLRNENRYMSDVTGSEQERLVDALADPIRDRFADYDSVLKRIDSVFLPKDTFIAFYETLFKQSTMDRLTSILDIDPRPGNFAKHINATPKVESMPDELLRQAAMKYRATYQVVSTRFGKEKVQELWPYARFIDL